MRFQSYKEASEVFNNSLVLWFRDSCVMAESLVSKNHSLTIRSLAWLLQERVMPASKRNGKPNSPINHGSSASWTWESKFLSDYLFNPMV